MTAAKNAPYMEMLTDAAPPYRSMFGTFAKFIASVWRRRRVIGYTVRRSQRGAKSPMRAAGD